MNDFFFAGQAFQFQNSHVINNFFEGRDGRRNPDFHFLGNMQKRKSKIQGRGLNGIIGGKSESLTCDEKKIGREHQQCPAGPIQSRNSNNQLEVFLSSRRHSRATGRGEIAALNTHIQPHSHAGAGMACPLQRRCRVPAPGCCWLRVEIATSPAVRALVGEGGGIYCAYGGSWTPQLLFF